MTLKDFINEPIVQLISFIFGLLGILLAFVFYSKAKVKKRMTIIRSDLGLVGKRFQQVSKISVFYENKQIENLTISEFTLFNSGNSVLNFNDIPQSSPISLHCQDAGKILEYHLSYISEEANGWWLEITNDKLAVKFDYLRPFDGCKIKVIHTCENLTIAGKLKESDLSEYRYFSIPNVKEARANFICAFIGAICIIPIGILKSPYYFFFSGLLFYGASAGYNKWKQASQYSKRKELFTSKIY